MLRKLIKHELKTIAKSFINMYMMMAAVAVMAKIFSLIFHNSNGNVILEFVIPFMSALPMGFAFGALALWVMTVISRFEKNIFQDEGYLMNTLPVPPELLYFSKLLTSLLTLLVTLIAIYLEFSIAHGSITYVWVSFGDAILASFNDGHGIFVMTWGALILLLQTVLLITSAYMSISIGHRALEHHEMLSAAVFILSWIAYQSIALGCFTLLYWLNIPNIPFEQLEIADVSIDVLTYLFAFGTICPAVGSIICSGITIHNLKKHLNLA